MDHLPRKSRKALKLEVCAKEINNRNRKRTLFQPVILDSIGKRTKERTLSLDYLHQKGEGRHQLQTYIGNTEASPLFRLNERI